MRLYKISANQVTVMTKRPTELGEGDILVKTAAQLEQTPLTGKQLVEIWNGLPGVEPTTRFKTRGIAVEALWKAFRGLPADEGPVPLTDPASKGEPRSGSKQAMVVAMLRRPEGASIDAIAESTGWQRHTVRGALAGAVRKKLGLAITSEKNAGGVRIYRIAGPTT